MNMQVLSHPVATRPPGHRVAQMSYDRLADLRALESPPTTAG